MAKSSLMFWTIFVVAIVLPAVVLVMTLAVLTMQVLLILVRLGAKVSARSNLETHGKDISPIFSVHVAIHNEPPSLVNATLYALSKQEFPDDRVEIIVIDNNTTNPALWFPIERECCRLGAQFRFLRREGVIGAKAGALNTALDNTRSDATQIVPIDADYVVQPNFLADAACGLGRILSNFPKRIAARAISPKGWISNLKNTSALKLGWRDGAEAVLLTGTLCVISRSALLAVGGRGAPLPKMRN